MFDLRKIAVIFVVAVLFAVLVNVTIEAFDPSPKYDDFCKTDYGGPYLISPETRTKEFPAPPIGENQTACKEVRISGSLRESCSNERGFISYKYGEDGCAVEPYCDTCNVKFQDQQKKHNLIVFIASSIAGLIGIAIGLYLPKKKNPINEWLGTGFLLGGLFAIFFGTVQYFSELGRYAKPIVIFIELILVIHLAYAKLGNKIKNKK